MTKEDYVDYYKVLQCDRNTSTEDLKKSYQRLILLLHPDKTCEGNNEQSDSAFHDVQKAWSVLKDPESRKQYDAQLICREHSDLLLYDTINISDMEFYSSESVYSYNCRCGGTYLLEPTETMSDKVVIGCDECSFFIQVNFEKINR